MTTHAVRVGPYDTLIVLVRSNGWDDGLVQALNDDLSRVFGDRFLIIVSEDIELVVAEKTG